MGVLPTVTSQMNNEDQIEQANTDDNPLFDIIQNLQTKLSSQPNVNNVTPKPITSTSDSSEFKLNNIMELLNNVGMNQTSSRK